MAEFQEVMRQLGRICAKNFGECDICDLHPFCPAKTFIDKYVKSNRTERLEEMVLSWAAEHPGPIYPTWKEWLEEQRVVVHFDSVNQRGTTVKWELTHKSNYPIPADIAQKLGIEPKEV